jgi:UTP--glucose-1-phosphate uridylyltransferase
MRALTGGRAKELLPVGGVPLLELVARECAASGIEELLVVASPDKPEIEQHLAPLARTPGMPARIGFVVQHDARGLADAIRLGREFAAGEPLVVALPDNLFVDDAPGVAQVIETHRATGLNVVAVVEIFAVESGRRGPTSVLPGALEGDEFRMQRIPDKGERGETFDTGGAPSAFTAVGRYVFLPELFATIDAVERTLEPGAELDDVPVMQALLGRGRLVGRRIRGRFLDAGLPGGYEEANRAIRVR